MIKRIAVNGFGRIGRNFVRTVMCDSQAQALLNIVAINLGTMSLEAAAHLFKYDTLLGTFSGTVALNGSTLVINGHPIALYNHLSPTACPWKQDAIEWVVECTGAFTKRAQAAEHIEAGAQRALISAPSPDADIMVVPGVNQADFNAQEHAVVSLGSCTTNAVVPTLKVLLDHCGLEYGFMTTVHAYTNSQVLLDGESKDLRCARAAAENIIPTSTGAAQSIDQVLPQLKNKMACTSIRVPVAKVSLIDITFFSWQNLTANFINEMFVAAAHGDLKNILDVSMQPLVSSDYMGNSYSVVIDGLMTQVVGKAGKVFGWYDNEWGYSQRLKDFLLCVK